MATVTPPVSIDRTGQTDVTLQMMQWLNGGMENVGGKLVANGTPGPYWGSGAGVPDDSQILLPAGAIYLVNNHSLYMTGDMVVGGTVIQGYRNRYDIEWNGNNSWIVMTNTQLDGGINLPARDCNIMLFENMNRFQLHHQKIRAQKKQEMGFMGEVFGKYEGRHAVNMVACKHYEVYENTIYAALGDNFRSNPRGGSAVYIVSVTAGSNVVNINTGLESKRFNAFQDDCPLISASGQRSESQSNWTREDIKFAKDNYGWPGGPDPPTAFPFMPNNATWAQWPKVNYISPTQIQCTVGVSQVTRTNQRIWIAHPHTETGGATFDGWFHNNVCWDCGRTNFVCQANYKDKITGRSALIENNRMYYTGYVNIDAIEDVLIKGLPNIYTNPGNDFGTPRHSNELLGHDTGAKLPRGSPINQAGSVYPTLSRINPAFDTRFSGMPSYTAFPMLPEPGINVGWVNPPEITQNTLKATSVDFHYLINTKPYLTTMEISVNRTPDNQELVHNATYKIFPGVQSSVSPFRQGDFYLTGLTPNTRYFWKATVYGYNGSQRDTGVAHNFWTLPGDPDPPTDVQPVITGLGVDQISTSSARIGFSTGANPASSSITFWRTADDPPVPLSRADAVFRTGVRYIVLTALEADTDYSFVASARSPGGKWAVNVSGTFSTLADPVPVGFGFNLADIYEPDTTSHSFHILAITSQPGTFRVLLVSQATGTPVVAVDETIPSFYHDYVVDGLNPLETYDIVLGSTNEDEEDITRLMGPWTTLAAPPTSVAPILSNVQVIFVNDDSATIGWTTDQAATSQLAVGITNTAEDPVLKTTHQVSVTGLIPATLYPFVARSRNSEGDQGSSEVGFFTTTDETVVGPDVTFLDAPIATLTDHDSTVITWRTLEPSTSKVYYGVGDNPAVFSTVEFETAEDTDLVTDHSVELEFLQPNTPYHYFPYSSQTAGEAP